MKALSVEKNSGELVEQEEHVVEPHETLSIDNDTIKSEMIET